MDLLFKRYASPLVLLNQMILADRFTEFVDEVVKIQNEEKDDQSLWEYFLHKVFDKSYAQFMREVKQPQTTEPVSKEQLETTVKDSFSMLNEFKILN